ncbi:MAG: hypothetical protein J1F31_00220 [Erysipelotrichales bacterium]|nr:hypothetical protein [Erysipelotrichales bacterium]
MEVIRLTTKKQLKQFINMADTLYAGDSFYVPYMKNDLLKTLEKLVIKDKTYIALSVVRDGLYIARVLFTISSSKQRKLDRCGFFSHFECVNEQEVADLLLNEMARILKEQGITYVEGTYFPFDQDNRRGIQVAGFEDEPMILTSYNKSYYQTLLEKNGFHKDFDTISYKMEYDNYDLKRIEPTVNKVMKRFDLYISSADFSYLDREIDDVHTVIEKATNDIIFDTAPTREDLVRIVAGWKSFLWPDFIFICRRRKDNQPIGVLMSVPNFYTVFRKMKGKSNIIALLKALYWKKRIRSIRTILQYVVPEYQNHGVNFALYHAFYLACQKRGINYVEAGTIMENNVASCFNVEKAGGKRNKIFRIYGREL